MPNALQEYLVSVTEKAAKDLVTALERIPVEKRAWSPAETARTALDQVAECAILAGSTAEILESRSWMRGSYEEYLQRKAALAAGDPAAIFALLDANLVKLVAVIRAIPDDALNVTMETPFGTLSLSQIMGYPYWNMAYHEGQINYIASILGCL